MNDQEILIGELIKARTVCRDLSIEHWLKYELFTWVWWLNLFFTVVPLVIWYKVVDKRRIKEIVIFGLLITIQASFLDVMGSELVLWIYPIRLIPQSMILFPADFIFLPVALMFVYQYYTRWKDFLIAAAVVSAMLAFVFEPIAILIGEYRMISWRLYYSFPIYIITIIFARLVTEGFLRRNAVR